MKMLFLLPAVLLCGSLANAQAPSANAYSAASQLFLYDASLPLNSRVFDHVDSAAFIREKFVINGWHGSRVPGLIALPGRAASKYPVVLLIDGIGGWKERWWNRESWNRGRVLIDSLLANGYGVAMVDAPGSGERKFENDFESVEPLLRKPAQFRDLVIQMTIEQRRVLDYLSARSDIDSSRIAVLGLSMGGMAAFYLAAVEPRIKAIVAGLTPLWWRPDVISPAHFAADARVPVLMLMGRTDPLYTEQQVANVYAQIPGDKELVWYPVGHRLPELYAGTSVAWFRKHLRSGRM